MSRNSIQVRLDISTQPQNHRSYKPQQLRDHEFNPVRRERQHKATKSRSHAIDTNELEWRHKAAYPSHLNVHELYPSALEYQHNAAKHHSTRRHQLGDHEFNLRIRERQHKLA